MDFYVPNRTCHCARCRCRGFMGPAMILTVGVLALLNNFTQFHFHQTWPIFLIVVGIVKVMGSSADTTGHVPPNLPERLRQGFAPGSYPSGAAGTSQQTGTVPPAQGTQPPQGVNNNV
jgi:hypothetical protein